MAPRWSPLLLLLLLPGGGPAGPPPGWPWGDNGDPGGTPNPPRPRCSGDRPGVTAPPPQCPPRLRLDVAADPAFPPAPGPRAVPAGGRVFVQVSLSRAPPGLGFWLRRCFLSPLSSPVPPPPAARGSPRGLRAGGGPGGSRRLLLSFLLPPRFPEPLQFLHCSLRLCGVGGGGGGFAPVPPRALLPRGGGGALGPGSPPGPPPGAPRYRSLRTVSRPIVVTLGPPGTAPPDAPPVPIPPPPPILRRPPAPPPPALRPPPGAPPAPTVPPGAVAAISFGAFVVGAALAGGLWFVHGRTGPRK
ncbi:transforming growth factor-beta receptor type 3-like protein [Phaenicophaeus curvirostris]|uniref:transforming growth factor-beta receptor type 3-like protein n=1 Tax=Phaenicophaeus curvirostris TaxID=33595 RepID=UPI0037F0F0EB